MCSMQRGRRRPTALEICECVDIGGGLKRKIKTVLIEFFNVEIQKFSHFCECYWCAITLVCECETGKARCS